jgi:nucleoside triphosphate diphosphatase
MDVPDPMSRLLAVMARLRAPDGCPWDQAQDFASIAPYTVEEAYEVADVIAHGPEPERLKDELGDLLLQVVYHARMAEERGWFGFADVAAAIADKMIRRHPHVFGDAEAAHAAETWETQKAAERATRAETGVLAGVPANLPALTRAEKLTKRAARVGFDWPDAEAVLEKLVEEMAELRAELATEKLQKERVIDETGDLLFVLANLARKLQIDPEQALSAANQKFERRFGFIEQTLVSEGKSPADSTLAEMEALWARAKAAERG